MSRPEKLSRWLILVLLIGSLLIFAAARWLDGRGVIEVHAAMPEKGGWSPDGLTVEAGQPMQLRLVSDDVVHGFAIGQDDRYDIELLPGQPVETTLSFAQPGRYIFYCTRWCGPNHWRMRGTLDVSGVAAQTDSEPPLYVQLGLDIDGEHHAEIIPEGQPSAARGSAYSSVLPEKYLSFEYFQRHSPVEAWEGLRTEPVFKDLDDQRIWDLVAYIWSAQTTSEDLTEGQVLYTENCAACHGETGAGDGVMADSLTHPDQLEQDTHNDASQEEVLGGHDPATPSDFTDPEHMLGASPAILHGKIVRGGMGTGMPYYGPIFTDAQIWQIISYLWTFQFQIEE